MEQNDVLDKVRKLLAKAEATVGTPESEAFQAKAFEMIAKYGIDENAARARADGSADAASGQLIAVTFRFPAPYAEERMLLMTGIGRALHCQSVRLNSQGQGIAKMFGVRSHVERAKFLHALLMPQMLAGASKALPDDPFNRDGSSSVVAHRRSWMAGFVATTHQRLVDAEERASGEYDKVHAGSHAEVMLTADVERAERALRKQYPNLTYGRRRSYGSGFADGAAAGRAADIGHSRIGNVRAAIGS